MDWSAVGAVGEVVGAAAVVATLVYVSRQLRNQNQALRTTIRDSVFQQLQAWNYQLIADRPFSLLFQRGAIHEDWSDIEEVDRARLIHVFYSFFKVFENIYLHVCDGGLDAEVWERNCAAFYAYAHQPGCQRYWTQRKGMFDPRFQAVVDKGGTVRTAPGADIAGLFEP